jgi:hypothetical protein
LSFPFCKFYITPDQCSQAHFEYDAAGAMIFVVVEELIPESHLGKNTDMATLSTMLGFVIMMILDVALG